MEKNLFLIILGALAILVLMALGFYHTMVFIFRKLRNKDK